MAFCWKQNWSEVSLFRFSSTAPLSAWNLARLCVVRIAYLRHRAEPEWFASPNAAAGKTKKKNLLPLSAQLRALCLKLHTTSSAGIQNAQNAQS